MNKPCSSKISFRNIFIKYFPLLLFCLILTAGLWSGTDETLANSPAMARSIVISPKNVPEEAKYLELLIPMPQDDPYYRSFNQTAADETGLTYQAPIVGYMDQDGYISYSFHMENASSKMKLENEIQDEYHFYAYEFCDNAYAGSQTHLEYIQKNFGTIKVALLDGEGTVLSVSTAASIKTGRSEYLAGTIAYDCASGQLSPSIYKGSAGSIFIIVFFLLLMFASLIGRAVFTAAVECGVALAFQIRPWSTVFLVNIISNIIFNLVLVFSTFLFQVPYLFFVTFGEIIVVWAENSIYRRFLSYNRTRILAFTVTANLTSLLLGLGLNYWLSDRFYWLAKLL